MSMQLRQLVIAFAAAGALVALTPALALDANAQSNGQGAEQGSSRSIDDVARMIRKKKRWEILEATPTQNGSVMRYRFKVINQTGKVKIINIDPRQPNLRRLEQ